SHSAASSPAAARSSRTVPARRSSPRQIPIPEAPPSTPGRCSSDRAAASRPPERSRSMPAAPSISTASTRRVGDLSGMGAIALGSGTLTAGTANSTTFGGAISGTGGLVKQGSGALTPSGASSYTGTTNINAGPLGGNGSPAPKVFVTAARTPGGRG